jgi:hypothetical protein
MRTVADPADLSDRFTVEVDPSVDAVDIDQAVAKFLLAVVRKNKTSRSQPGSPAAAVGFSISPEVTERQNT